MEKTQGLGGIKRKSPRSLLERSAWPIGFKKNNGYKMRPFCSEDQGKTEGAGVVGDTKGILPGADLSKTFHR